MKLYGLKTCATCRKSLAFLKDAKFRDVRKDGVPDALLIAAEARFGDALLNKKSTTWRELSEEARAKPQGELLRLHPTLMKRPLIEKDGELFLGWTAETQAALGVS